MISEQEILTNLVQHSQNLQQQLTAQSQEIVWLRALILSLFSELESDAEGQQLTTRIIRRAGTLQSDSTLPVQTENSEVWDAYLIQARRYLIEGTEERAS